MKKLEEFLHSLIRRYDDIKKSETLAELRHAGLAPASSVGWVECNETHHGYCWDSLRLTRPTYAVGGPYITGYRHAPV